MILYLDTSALVKAYIQEQHSKDVLAAMQQAEIIATHTIAFVEAHAAFFRLHREKKITTDDLDSIIQSFKKDWINYLQVENNQILLDSAVELTEAFALRAYDSIHLAAARIILQQTKQLTTFACFDKHLNKAARILGMQLIAT